MAIPVKAINWLCTFYFLFDNYTCYSYFILVIFQKLIFYHICFLFLSFDITGLYCNFFQCIQWRSKGPAGPATVGARGAEGAHQGPARKK